jgi:hypothetical protein
MPRGPKGEKRPADAIGEDHSCRAAGWFAILSGRFGKITEDLWEAT